MLNVYSKNVVVAADSAIPLNNVSLLKGTSAILQGASSIVLNKCGIYEISISATGIASAAGDISIEVYKNGVAQAGSIITETAADTTSKHALSLTSLVQVPTNSNVNCPCSIPTVISLINTGVATTYDNIEVTVTRI